MKVLLDTHVWLWWISEPERLPRRVVALMEDSGNEILWSVASSWEVAIKYALGKLPLPERPQDFVIRRLARDGIGTLHVEHRHALHVASLPFHHHDPFDRILIAQAEIERIPIVTADPKFRPYGVRILWDG